MRIGNIIASIGIVLSFIGFICLPFWNLRELPYLADPAYPKGGLWIALAQSGVFARPGIILIVGGGFLYLIAKLLPKRYWKTAEDLFNEEIEKGYRKKNNSKMD